MNNDNKIGIGIDFGNSNTTAAVYDGNEVFYIQLDEASSDPAIMPTSLYISREYMPIVGSKAVTTFLQMNAGRIIRPKKVEFGQISITNAEMDKDLYSSQSTINATVATMMDVDLPGRLFRGLKRFLGNSTINRFSVFEKNLKTEALMTPIYKLTLDKIKEHLDNNVSPIHIGRPVVFDGTPGEANKTALTRMNTICGNAGINKYQFFPEPLAAAISYNHQNPSKESRTLLLFDFGGGTLDLSLAQVHHQDLKVLGNAGIPKAGDKIDQMIYIQKVFPELGKGAVLTRKNDNGVQTALFPFEEFQDHLLNWQSTHFLNQGKYNAIIAEAKKASPEVGEKVDRLTRIIKSNASYNVLQAIEKAKIALSSEKESFISMPELDLHVKLTRDDINTILDPLQKEIREAISALLKEHGLNPENIDGVVCTGGSSKITVIQKMLDTIFPGKVKTYNNFTSIAAGLAIASYHGTEYHLN